MEAGFRLGHIGEHDLSGDTFYVVLDYLYDSNIKFYFVLGYSNFME